jgi:hypothetical protein
MSNSCGQNIRKLRDMKPLTNEMKRNKIKITILVTMATILFVLPST